MPLHSPKEIYRKECQINECKNMGIYLILVHIKMLNLDDFLSYY